jgi:hypothetical protein
MEFRQKLDQLDRIEVSFTEHLEDSVIVLVEIRHHFRRI